MGEGCCCTWPVEVFSLHPTLEPTLSYMSQGDAVLENRNCFAETSKHVNPVKSCKITTFSANELFMKRSSIASSELAAQLNYNKFRLSFYDNEWTTQICIFKLHTVNNDNASPVHRVRGGHDADPLPRLHPRHPRHRAPRHLLPPVPGAAQPTAKDGDSN